MRNLLRPLVLLVVPLLALTACGAETKETTAAGGQTQGGAEAGAYPVTIKNKFGDAVIKETPKRVVAVGLVEQDALLALGVVPVGTTEWFGEKPGALFPWAKAKLGSGAIPTVLTDKDGIQFEKVAALAPDLIIGSFTERRGPPGPLRGTGSSRWLCRTIQSRPNRWSPTLSEQRSPGCAPRSSPLGKALRPRWIPQPRRWPTARPGPARPRPRTGRPS